MNSNQIFTATTQLNAQQAKNELRDLAKTYADLEAKKNKMIATDGKNAKGIKEVNNAMRETKAHMSALQTRLQQVDHVMANLSTAGIKDIQAAIKKINAELRSGAVERGSAEWRKLQGDLKACKAELNSINQESAQSESIWSKLGNGFNKYQSLVVSALASFTGLTLTVRQAVKAYSDMEEEEFQVVKYTGMTKKEVEDLNEEFKKMDTRTSREQLNQLADDAGRLGISSKQGVMEFVDAADKINVALGDDLGDKATETIGKLAMMFGEDSKYGLNTAMLKTGSVINELAQTSSASGGYLAEFASRVAGVGKSAGLTQAQIMSFGSVLDQNMQQDEMAATAFSQLVSKMFLDPAKFARLAGQDVKSFSSLLKTNANAAILQFLAAMKSKGGFSTIAPMFAQMGLDGARATSVLSVMADKLGDINKAQVVANNAYEQGTSLTKEFNVQNETVQAGLDKANKRFKDLVINLGEKLEPVAKHAITLGSMGIRVLSDIVNWVYNNISVLTKLAIVVGAYYTVIGVATIYEKRYLASKLLTIIADKSEVAWLAIKRAAMLATAVITNTLTLNIDKARKAQQALNMVVKMNPWGLAASAIAAIIVLIISLKNKTVELTNKQIGLANANKEIRDAQKTAAESTVDLRTKVSVLTSIIRDNSRSVNDRRAAIAQLEKIIPGYTAQISNEGKVTRENTKAIDDYLKKLEQKALAEAMYDKLKAAMKEKTDADMASDVWENAVSFRKQRMNEKGHESRQGSIYLGTSSAGVGVSSYGEKNDTRVNDLKLLAADKAGLSRSQKRNEVADAKITAIKSYIKKRKIQIDLTNSIPSDTSTAPSGGGGGGTTSTTSKTNSGGSNKNNDNSADKIRQQQREQEIKDLESSIATIRHLYNMSYYQGTMDEEEYGKKMNQLKINELSAKIDIEKEYGTEEQHVDAQYALDDEVNQQEEEKAKKQRDEKLEAEKKLQEDLQRVKEEYLQTPLEERQKIEMDVIQRLYDAKLLSEVEFQEAKLAIQDKYKKLADNDKGDNKSNEPYSAAQHFYFGGATGELLNFFDMLGDKSKKGWDKFASTAASALSITGTAISELSSYYQACSDEEVQATQKKYEKQIEAAGANTAKGKKLKAKEEKEIAEIKNKYAQKQANMQIAQAIASTAISAINAYSSAAAIPVIGYVLAPIAAAMAIAAGAIQIATIRKQASVQQEGYFSGGLTGFGDYRQEAGVVHRGEFVLNHEAVNNPNLTPMIRVIDNAQRNNKVASLKPNDINPTVPTINTVVVAQQDTGTAEAIASVNETTERNSKAIDRLNKHLDDGIESYVVIDGPNGLHQQYKHYQKLISNK